MAERNVRNGEVIHNACGSGDEADNTGVIVVSLYDSSPLPAMAVNAKPAE